MLSSRKACKGSNSMNSKALGLVIAFTALATALNLIRIPVPYLLTYSYQLGDIILVIAFLLFGVKIGLTVAIFNMFASMAIFPNPVGIIGAPYYLFSVLTMVLGVYLFGKIIKPRILNKPFFNAKSATLATLCSVLTRTLMMLPMDFLVFPYLVSLVSGLTIYRSIQHRLNGNARHNSIQHYGANLCDSNQLFRCKKSINTLKIYNY